MKKPLITIILGLFFFSTALYSDPCLEDLEIKGSVGYSSRYIHRGSRLAKHVIKPSFELGLPVTYLRTYAGAWAVFPFRNPENNGAQQINPYGGFTADLFTHCITGDLGAIYYNYTNTNCCDCDTFRSRNTNRQIELYGGITFNYYMNPAIYAFYNIHLRQWVIEPSISESFELCEFSKGSLTLDIYVRAGWLHAERFNGDQRPHCHCPHHNEYFYIEGQFDLTYHINECVAFSIGPRVSSNTDHKIWPHNKFGPYTANASVGSETHFWLAAALTFGWY